MLDPPLHMDVAPWLVCMQIFLSRANASRCFSSLTDITRIQLFHVNLPPLVVTQNSLHTPCTQLRIGFNLRASHVRRPQSVR